MNSLCLNIFLKAMVLSELMTEDENDLAPSVQLLIILMSSLQVLNH